MYILHLMKRIASDSARRRTRYVDSGQDYGGFSRPSTIPASTELTFTEPVTKQFLEPPGLPVAMQALNYKSAFSGRQILGDLCANRLQPRC